jgi:hypothetical protein
MLDFFFRCSAAAFKRLQGAGSSTTHLRSRPVPNSAAQFLCSGHNPTVTPSVEFCRSNIDVPFYPGGVQDVRI